MALPKTRTLVDLYAEATIAAGLNPDDPDQSYLTDQLAQWLVEALAEIDRIKPPI